MSPAVLTEEYGGGEAVVQLEQSVVDEHSFRSLAFYELGDAR